MLHAEPRVYSLESSYPLEAPPSYSVAVQSYRQTLIQYIPAHRPAPGDPVVVEVDEESGMERTRPDDVRYSVEKIVAMFVVASLLLIIAAALGWVAVARGVLG